MVVQEIPCCTGSRRPGRGPGRRYIWSRNAPRYGRRTPSAAAAPGWRRHCPPPAARRACRRSWPPPSRSTMDKRGIGRRLQEQHAWSRAASPPPRRQIAAIHQRVGDAEARQDLPRSHAGRSRTSPWPPPHDRRSSAPTGTRPITAAMPVAVARATGAPSSAAMRSSNMVTVGLPKRRILIAADFALEAGFGFFGRLIGIAGGEEQRLATSPGRACALCRRAPPRCAFSNFRAFCWWPWSSFGSFVARLRGRASSSLKLAADRQA